MNNHVVLPNTLQLNKAYYLIEENKSSVDVEEKEESKIEFQHCINFIYDGETSFIKGYN